MKTVSLVIFIIMYVFMIARPAWRQYIALGTAALFLVLRILPWEDALGAVNWNVIMMMSGTMIVVHYFIESRMPEKIADILLDKAKNVMWLTIYMSAFAGIISAFIDNVATVLIVVPVALAVCKELEISPVSMVLSIAVSSNLQGAATLVGDTTSIMLGSYAMMDFTDFFWMKGHPGIFFAVELGALMTIVLMFVIFRKQKQPVANRDYATLKGILPTVMIVGLVALLVAASFIPNKPELTNGFICLGMGILALLADFARDRSGQDLKDALKSIDCSTLLLLLGLFLVIGGVSATGVIDDAAAIITKVGGSDLFLLYTIIVWGSVLFSAFIDNIPYVATMLPIITKVAEAMCIEPYVLYFGLLVGATLGGNLTPIGASANITAVGMLRKEGFEVSFGQFMKIGVPFTLTAVTAGYLFVWFVWGA